MTIVCPCCAKEFELGAEMAEHIRSQVRTKEFEHDVASRVESESTRIQAEAAHNIERLQHEMSQMKSAHEFAMASTRAGLEAEISRLRSNIELEQSRCDAEVTKARLEAASESTAIISHLRAELDARSREVEYYRDLKARMSTKMVGETLEQHCETAFNQIRMAAFPHAEFHKDNAVSAASGSKGDYIYREQADGVELLSIMFEMKNDMDTTATRKKNEAFLKELDKDRREKGCEYAVLVSLLEPDSELYNQGIVDMSWQYPKLYVIRPQFFIPMITLLRNAALGALDAKRELAEMKRQDMELTAFRDAFDAYRGNFGYNLDQAGKRQEEAIAEIDKAIRRLEAAKTALQACGKQMSVMDKKMSEMTVEKLCASSPSVLAAMSGD